MISWPPHRHAQWVVLSWQSPNMHLGWQIAISLLVFVQRLAPLAVPILLCTDPESLF